MQGYLGWEENSQVLLDQFHLEEPDAKFNE
jgi:hypothetical protein